jgi:hypothetical protein
MAGSAIGDQSEQKLANVYYEEEPTNVHFSKSCPTIVA